MTMHHKLSNCRMFITTYVPIVIYTKEIYACMVTATAEMLILKECMIAMISATAEMFMSKEVIADIANPSDYGFFSIKRRRRLDDKVKISLYKKVSTSTAIKLTCISFYTNVFAAFLIRLKERCSVP